MLFREYCLKLSEERTYWVLRKTQWVLQRTRWVRFCTEIRGCVELTELSARNSARAKKLTELGVWNRTLRDNIRPSLIKEGTNRSISTKTNTPLRLAFGPNRKSRAQRPTPTLKNRLIWHRSGGSYAMFGYVICFCPITSVIIMPYCPSFYGTFAGMKKSVLSKTGPSRFSFTLLAWGWGLRCPYTSPFTSSLLVSPVPGMANVETWVWESSGHHFASAFPISWRGKAVDSHWRSCTGGLEFRAGKDLIFPCHRSAGGEGGTIWRVLWFPQPFWPCTPDGLLDNRFLAFGRNRKQNRSGTWFRPENRKKLPKGRIFPWFPFLRLLFAYF